MKIKRLIEILQCGDVNDKIVLTLKGSQTELVIGDIERHSEIGDTVIFELVEKKIKNERINLEI